MTNLLEIRKEMNERKPDFIRQDHQRRKRLGRKLKWRKPKGVHSKMRHHFKGRRKMPSPGYRSPSKVRGLHSSGLKIVSVSSVSDISKIKKESEGIIISKQVGTKKKLEILKMAKEIGIAVLNANTDERIKSIEEFINSKKKHKKENKKEAKEKSETKEQGQKLTDEQKREIEKKEKDKLLTKKA